MAVTTTKAARAEASASSLVVHAARTTLKLTTLPLHVWIRMCVLLLKLVGMGLATPQKVVQAASGFFARMLSTRERDQLHSDIASVGEFSREMATQAKRLQTRLASYEHELRKTERMREHTFEEMQELRSDLAQLFDSIQEQNKVEARVKRAKSKSPAPPPKAASRASSVIWLTHASVIASIGAQSLFFSASREQSVERKVMLTLLLPMAWLYLKFVRRHAEHTALLVSSMAWFTIGFVVCTFFHPHVPTTPSEV